MSTSVGSPTSMLDDLHARLHLWLIPLEGAPDLAWVAENRGLLSPEETARCDRYLRAGDADLFLVAHVAVRRVLSLYRDVAPKDWRFATGPHGRPEIANAAVPPTLRFNLSHAPGMTAVLVHDGTDSGVDVELIGRVADPIAMSRTVFADAEREALLALAPQEQATAFCRLWTLKESFLKAKGLGLAIPLKEFWFNGFEGDGPIGLGCTPAVDTDPEAWTFTVALATDRHVVATGCRAGVGAERSVRVEEVDLSRW